MGNQTNLQEALVALVVLLNSLCNAFTGTRLGYVRYHIAILTKHSKEFAGFAGLTLKGRVLLCCSTFLSAQAILRKFCEINGVSMTQISLPDNFWKLCESGAQLPIIFIMGHFETDYWELLGNLRARGIGGLLKAPVWLGLEFLLGSVRFAQQVVAFNAVPFAGPGKKGKAMWSKVKPRHREVMEALQRVACAAVAAAVPGPVQVLYFVTFGKVARVSAAALDLVGLLGLSVSQMLAIVHMAKITAWKYFFGVSQEQIDGVVNMVNTVRGDGLGKELVKALMKAVGLDAKALFELCSAGGKASVADRLTYLAKAYLLVKDMTKSWIKMMIAAGEWHVVEARMREQRSEAGRKTQEDRKTWAGDEPLHPFLPRHTTKGTVLEARADGTLDQIYAAAIEQCSVASKKRHQQDVEAAKKAGAEAMGGDSISVLLAGSGITDALADTAQHFMYTNPQDRARFVTGSYIKKEGARQGRIWLHKEKAPDGTRGTGEWIAASQLPGLVGKRVGSRPQHFLKAATDLFTGIVLHSYSAEAIAARAERAAGRTANAMETDEPTAIRAGKRQRRATRRDDNCYSE